MKRRNFRVVASKIWSRGLIGVIRDGMGLEVNDDHYLDLRINR